MLKADVFPAEIHLPDGRFVPNGRLMICQDDKVVAWVNVTGVMKPAYVGRASTHELLPEPGAARRHQRVVSQVEGGMIIANRIGGCGGCGNPAANLSEQDAIQADRALA